MREPDSWAEAEALDRAAGRIPALGKNEPVAYSPRQIRLRWHWRLNNAAVSAKTHQEKKPEPWISVGLRCDEVAEADEFEATPKMNELHLQWLALYQFDELSAEVIAKRYGVEEPDTVKKAVGRTAKKMGLSLRSGKRGRTVRIS